MDREARELLFSDETRQFRSPSEPDPGDTVVLRFRAGKDSVRSVEACFLQGQKRIEMKKISSDRDFDWFETRFTCGEKKVSYGFIVWEAESGASFLYDKSGLCGSTEERKFRSPFWFVPGFHVPDWSKGALQYQIFVDRFKNGDRRNDVANNEYYYINGHAKHLSWETPVYGQDIRHFYGGDLQGVREKLNYLQDLGVEAVYLNPIFISPSSHKYDIQDYNHVDPHLAVIVDDMDHAMQGWEQNNGFACRYIRRVLSRRNLAASDQYFADLCKEIHSRGMRIILDGVFNHCGDFNLWFDRQGIYAEKKGYETGAFRDTESPYRSFFNFSRENPTQYDSWWGFETLPKLNYETSRELQEKVFAIAEKWAGAPYNIDGWRLDVAADLGYSPEFNHEFWQEFRRRVKAVNPNLVIIAEHYGDPSPWLQGDQWDTVMNYDAFMEPLSYFLTGMEKHSDRFVQELFQNGEAFFDTMRDKMARMQWPTVQCAMNELSNHDHSRFLTRTNKRVGRIETVGSEAAGRNLDKAAFRIAVAVQMTWPGAPTIYYGDEAGQVGWTDPDCRRVYPWEQEDGELIRLHRDLARVRGAHPVFASGSLRRMAAGYGYIAYARFNEMESAVILANNTDNTIKDKLSILKAGGRNGDEYVVEFQTGPQGHSLPGSILYPVYNGKLEVEVPAHTAMVLLRK